MAGGVSVTARCARSLPNDAKRRGEVFYARPEFWLRQRGDDRPMPE